MRRKDTRVNSNLRDSVHSCTRSTRSALPHLSVPHSRPSTAPSGGRTAVERQMACAQGRELASRSHFASFSTSSGSSSTPLWDDDGLCEVFKRLDAGSLAAACRVCRDWRRVGTSDSLWMLVYLRHLPNLFVSVTLEISNSASCSGDSCLAASIAKLAPLPAASRAEMLLEVPTTEEGARSFHRTELARQRRARGLQRNKLSVTTVLRGHTARINQVAAAARCCFSASDDGTLRVWGMTRGFRCTHILEHSDGVRSMDFNGTQMVSASSDRTVRVWSAASFKPEGVLRGHTAGVRQVSFLPSAGEASVAVSCALDCTLRVWRTAPLQQRPICTLPGHTKPVISFIVLGKPSATRGLAITSSCPTGVGARLVSASMDRTALVFDIQEARGARVAVLTGHSSDVTAVCSLAILGQSRDSQAASMDLVATGSYNWLTLWDVRAPTRPAMRLLHPAENNVVLGGRHMASTSNAHVNHLMSQGWILGGGSTSGWVRSWDVRAPRRALACCAAAHSNAVSSLALDGTRVMSSGLDGTVAAFDSLSGDPLGSAASHQLGVTDMTYTGQHMFTAGLAAARQGWIVKVWSYPSK